MLRITQNSNAKGAKSYYTNADYYSEGQELVGRWRGRGAAMLGLSGTVEKSDWDRLCDNRRPEDGKPLTARRKAERRVGYDLNFHCPKSVSLVYGLTQDERILDAFQSSVLETMEEIEAEAKSRVRKSGKDEDRVTGNLVWGEFTHFTARPEAGTPDPHLHAHCFVFNATHDEHEGRWKAVQLGDIKRDASYFEAVFHSKLAYRLESLGVETVRTAKGWEIAGFDTQTLARFSRRTARIERIARERGISDPARKAELGAQTRVGKAKELSMPELRELWRSRLGEPEASAIERIAASVGTEQQAERDPETERTDHTLAAHPTHIARDAVTHAVEHCFERSSVVTERGLLARALKLGVGKASRESVERVASAEPLVRATRSGQRLVTTEAVLAEERAMLDFARKGRGACRPVNSDPTSITFNRDWLNPQQKNAVRHVLTSRDRVVLIRGAAGTGKTTMMQEAKGAIEAAGLKVFAFAPSAAASHGVLRQEGFESAETVARLLADPKLQEQVQGSLLWVDEAGLLGTKTMRELFELAERLNSRVVLSGDRRQHGSVERGAALRLLEDEAGLRPAEIKEILRQKEQYKAAVKDLSEGKIPEAFERLNRLGWIREIDDERRERTLADAYLGTIREKKTALVVSPTHAEGDRITSAIRDVLKEEKLLGADTRKVESLIPRSLTLGERRDALNYEPGDVLVFHQNAKGHRKGDRLTVGDDPLPLEQAERFTVFRSSPIELASGDRIRISKNGTTADRKQRLNHGDLLTLKGFSKAGDLVLDDGRIIGKDFGHLTHGYVITSHASQGKTVDRVFIGQSSASFGASSREQFYVSASRGREQAIVFTDNKLALLEAVDRSDERLSGTELVAGLFDAQRLHLRERLTDLARHAPEVDTSRQREEVVLDR